MQELLQLKDKNPKRVIGLMSGTSVDGIDACLVEISGNGIQTKTHILAFGTYPYHESTRAAIFDVCNPKTGTVDKICQLNFYLGKLFSEAAISVANKAQISITDVDLIGSHGQTIYHLPNPVTQQDLPISPGKRNDGAGCEYFSTKLFSGCNTIPYTTQYLRSTLQIGEPSVIAQETGVTTVADFRPRDMAADGQGAPLVPYADFVLFGDKTRGRALQNIGGIANVTFLPRNCTPEDIIAFDTGPGNMIMDRIVELITNNTSHFDEGGILAAKGRTHDTLLTTLLAHPYFLKPPPKTTGREEFGKQFADELYKNALCSGVKESDILTTVTAFTARTIADSYKRWIVTRHNLSEVILSGGGSYNATLIEILAHYLGPSIEIHTIDKFGIAPSAREALAFAILANETISGNANNIPSATGAKEAVIMGKIIPGRKR
ncbi:MAG: anhydro-N-acetylmuramic acid kinase [Candidatus Jettenia sp.]|uniref:Anhydro-N-acetylmuramic acid kinase n=1 Tax=Candidatus Jettenia caeni TaxID=247490 RepID=I3IJP9_9BACT|nr:anhydro-N-acetylmuramic acid kinase [Candidatus Jettenia sp. AMX1]MBC6928837.1 anhydro-N-acetylmuramic acid kinase [Candidatus Jettenia sp.]GAB61944.1 anhydro-N-acetylmuramic acid kinase [Candidatus Jettenia caeni]KAA0250551.1 MAG: anhydro-N-acetylmuramic acid kinase [Candidatus Jettenia sp. AMX1]MCE7881038.1 anhydro-N-acetylmuramic acid kinase [Candidatus Jettenia sp. AMX1]MDL1938762.1 anhydro-N-acetylmuramic acid kinase [Candidatus Jettenia sp. AMX1]